MNQHDVAVIDHNTPTMSPEAIHAAAKRMMHQYERTMRVDFYDHWLGRLGLNPVVARLEKARQATAKAKTKR